MPEPEQVFKYERLDSRVYETDFFDSQGKNITMVVDTFAIHYETGKVFESMIWFMNPDGYEVEPYAERILSDGLCEISIMEQIPILNFKTIETRILKVDSRRTSRILCTYTSKMRFREFLESVKETLKD